MHSTAHSNVPTIRVTPSQKGTASSRDGRGRRGNLLIPLIPEEIHKSSRGHPLGLLEALKVANDQCMTLLINAPKDCKMPHL